MGMSVHVIKCIDCGAAFDCACPDYDTNLDSCFETVCANWRARVHTKEPRYAEE